MKMVAWLLGVCHTLVVVGGVTNNGFPLSKQCCMIETTLSIHICWCRSSQRSSGRSQHIVVTIACRECDDVGQCDGGTRRARRRHRRLCGRVERRWWHLSCVAHRGIDVAWCAVRLYCKYSHVYYFYYRLLVMHHRCLSLNTAMIVAR